MAAPVTATKPVTKPSTATAPAARTAGAAGQAAPAVAATTTEKRKYETVILGLSEVRKPLFNRVKGLADTLGCKASDLIWHSLEAMLQNPPKAAPAGAKASSGTSPGFWVLHTNDATGRLSGVKVIEVASRNQVDGGDRMFVRFKAGDDTSRNRARAQALRSANYDLQLVGIKQDVKVTAFNPNA